MKMTDRFYPVFDDFRDPYSRDRERIVHSKSFRVLEYKTQVFINTDGDYFRTRLTHSLEVSQIARTIAISIGLNETLCEAIALSHDLGHTPFGHVGGDELDRVLKANGNKNGFEHNFQSFRVVTKLEKRYENHDGLNLTFATLEGILKHSTPYDKPFIPENLKDIFMIDFHPSLEAMIVDLSDEIAYISHDIDDGIEKGLISFDDLKENTLVDKILKKIKDIKNQELFRYKFVSELISFLVFDVIQNSKVIKEKIKADEKLPIRFSKNTRTELSKLKKILFKKLYRHEKIVKRMFMGKVCIRKLFEACLNEPQILPLKIREQDNFAQNPSRAIADFIASLSDRGALMLYKELYLIL